MQNTQSLSSGREVDREMGHTEYFSNLSDVLILRFRGEQRGIHFIILNILYVFFIIYSFLHMKYFKLKRSKNR